jgi:hypothetical protein
MELLMQTQGTLAVLAAALDDAQDHSHPPACITSGGAYFTARAARQQLKEALECLSFPGGSGFFSDTQELWGELVDAYSLVALVVHALNIDNPLKDSKEVILYPQGAALKAAARIANEIHDKCDRLSLKMHASQRAAA